ncbi:hypothetical protein [Halobacterium yunchengense]|uniref:hypothetical protein n=1 Tax=Halobacterium yunchengense TaxID=3108497 RepID=UPI00300BABDE
MNAWKLVGGLLVVLGVFQVLAALGAPTLAAGASTAVSGLALLGMAFLVFYRADLDDG